MSAPCCGRAESLSNLDAVQPHALPKKSGSREVTVRLTLPGSVLAAAARVQ
jgi:hypothetical protein